MQDLCSTRHSDLVEMDMTLSLIDCWEDFEAKFDVWDVGDCKLTVSTHTAAMQYPSGKASLLASMGSESIPSARISVSRRSLKLASRTPSD
ncbi:hypothetical protein V7S43_003804 [Phytophthora oleae]|uniref:Uncharacterized protein n=1 Tax=Phytophthora oleae TaxID=2107226 RepID=A0ABD3FXB3_9STRA